MGRAGPGCREPAERYWEAGPGELRRVARHRADDRRMRDLLPRRIPLHFPTIGVLLMNRRTFLTASAAAAPLASAIAGQAQTDKRLKVLIPMTSPEQLSELREAAPGAELVPCRNEGEAIERVADAAASY